MATVLEIQQFHHGLVNPLVAVVMSALGCALGLVFAARARRVRGGRRVRLLSYAGVAIGGPGAWLAHVIAMLGFDVPASDLRYDPTLILASAGVGVAAVAVGLMVTHRGRAVRGRATTGRVLAGGLVTGAGLIVSYALSVLAIRVGGVVGFEPVRAGLAVGAALLLGVLVASYAALVEGPGSTSVAAAVLGSAFLTFHYAVMVTLRVEPSVGPADISGVNPVVLLAPLVLVGGLLLAILAFVLSGHSELAKMRAIRPPHPEPPRVPVQATPTVALPSRYPPELRESLAIRG